ncbi:5,10-methylenetetrahydrofolate reductase [Ceraceosorus bombacis]|uniref:5,10-methylenetetrahydrofolate reductase n=1 Tax=Ceraceosorus bombacis TaxID=401625 RepID=A0A0P1B8I9_9BASI|nr:5,10-methylenetetrahydrofolate reductase [Ceraceosorus bombacis]
MSAGTSSATGSQAIPAHVGSSHGALHGDSGTLFPAKSTACPHPSHIPSILSHHSSTRPAISLEFFPPKTSSGLQNLYARILRMKTQCGPSWMQVTWGAGGSTQNISMVLAGRVHKGLLRPADLDWTRWKSPSLEGESRNKTLEEREIEAIVEAPANDELATECCLHLTCTNVSREALDITLKQARAIGIRNLLALRGDPPRGSEYWTPSDNRFQHAEDLVRYIRSGHGDWFSIGVAGYPEGHTDSLTPSGEAEIPVLLSKQRAGASFIVTQLFYDVSLYHSWLANARAAGITIPIIPGVMPIQNYTSFRRITGLCKIQVPQELRRRLEDPTPEEIASAQSSGAAAAQGKEQRDKINVRNDDARVKEVGIEWSREMCRLMWRESVKSREERGAMEESLHRNHAAFHMCTLNLEKSVTRILHDLSWAGPSQMTNKASTHDAAFAENTLATNGTNAADSGSARSVAKLHATLNDSLSVSAPAALWDEFTNGRYGDSRSPAFGEIDGYGVSLKVPPADALRVWRTPVTEGDISALFVAYLSGEIQAIPWCDIPILNETQAIREELLSLNRAPSASLGQGDHSTIGKGWWTVGSQPAIDGVDSLEPTFGFGPKGGYIFQKAFVEFFVDEEQMLALCRRVEESDGLVGLLAGNREGNFKTTLEPNAVNAVTWGVFPGQEIAQSTIIEEESFKAWRDEAFEIWAEWELLFPQGSPTQRLLKSIGDNKWLVTVIHHDFKDPGALWRFLGCGRSEHSH